MSLDKCLSLILGGGQGTRLFPLTKERCKPAIGFGGKYRLIDIPLSNSIHSGIKKIYVLTQFLTESLHRHIVQTYIFDNFSQGFVRLLPAEQTHTHLDWFQGNADAVRQSIRHFKELPVATILILSGDHLYKMDFSHLESFHRRNNADVTIASIPVSDSEIKRMGVIKKRKDGKLLNIIEKPDSLDLIQDLQLKEAFKDELRLERNKNYYLASMGIYMFKKEALIDILEKNTDADFGRDIIPWALSKYNCFTFTSTGYWKDIGTIKTYYDENMKLMSKDSRFKLIDEQWPLYTHPRFLPPSHIKDSSISNSLVAEGCFIEHSTLNHCIVGNRSVINKNTIIKDSILLGNDYYTEKKKKRQIKLHIGQNTTIERAIIDKNVVIGDNCVISPKSGFADEDGRFHYVRDGITIIPRGTIIPHKTVI
ncbi:sugar phosphate nucleotidyltransferase [Chlamydiota bacterium]